MTLFDQARLVLQTAQQCSAGHWAPGVQEHKANYGWCPISQQKAENIQALGQNCSHISTCPPTKTLKFITRCWNLQNHVELKAQKSSHDPSLTRAWKFSLDVASCTQGKREHVEKTSISRTLLGARLASRGLHLECKTAHWADHTALLPQKLGFDTEKNTDSRTLSGSP